MEYLSHSVINKDSVFRLGMNFDLQFPEDLFSPKYSGNFMLFFINEQKYLVGGKKPPLKVRRKILNENGVPVTVEEERKVTATTSTNASRRMNQTTVTTGAIALYIPGDLNVSYKVNYDEADIGFVLGTALRGNFADFLKGTAATVTTREGMVSFLSKNPVLSSLAGADLAENLAKTTNALGGFVENPFKQLFFSGLSFRRFQFKFTMLPRSQKEAIMINNIVELFKYHMHPEERSFAGGRFFVVPSDFDIEFYRINELSNSSPQNLDTSSVFENEFLFSLSTCVLTDMSVNYTPSSEGFITHKDGTPLGVNMSLQFIETEILTKKRIEELNKKKFLTREIVSPTVRSVNG